METSGRGLFRLPRELRDHIYRRVLVLPQPLHLFADGRKVQLFAPGRPARHWLALLFTNREIRDEAAKILYGSHESVLVDTSRRQVILLESSLGSIGSVNAGHLGNICINFPAVGKKGSRGNGEESEEAASSMLWKEYLRGLKLLQEMCSGLTTLVTHVHDKNSRGLVVPRGAGD